MTTRPEGAGRGAIKTWANKKREPIKALIKTAGARREMIARKGFSPMDDAKAETSDAPGPAFDAAGDAKRLLRTVRSAALATSTAEYPFVSLVNIATYYDGSPILLLSQLAAHTRHLAADPRLSLLLCQGGEGDPLAHPRLTLLGRTERIDDPDRRAVLRTRFLNRHPKSALYADFTDFAFHQVTLERAHLNGGFARAAALSAEQVRTSLDDAADLIGMEAAAISHINTDHAAVPALFAQAFGRCGAGDWRVTGLDPEGLDLAKDDEICRVTFPSRVTTGVELRRVLMDLASEARRYLAGVEKSGERRL
jgi:heme iron utilization protein